jgi:general secretion pathway protein F
LSAVVRDVSDRIRDGKPLSESLAAFPALFSRLYCALVHAGEASGGLSVALRRLADYMEEDEELRNSLKASLTYPLFVSAVSAATVAVLVGFVVPRLADLLSDMGQALPLPTRVLVGFSGFISAWWWLLLAAGAAAVIAAIRFYLSDRGRLLVDEYILRLPFWGEVALKSEVARFMRTLSLLLSSGQAITLSLEISSSVLENSILKREIRGFKDQVIAGTSLSQAVAGSRYMPRMAVNVISIGEEAGSLDKSLSRIASEYEKECDRTMKAAVRLLEPSVILVMGLVVGFIVIAMLLPIFQINLIVR